jgi:DNA topoisomerase I
LKEITEQDITAKDFRTWAGTVLAALALKEVDNFDSAAEAKRNMRTAIERVAARLGNTPTICRKCYVHPEVLNSYLEGNLKLEIESTIESKLRDKSTGLQQEEAAVLALLLRRLQQPLDADHRCVSLNAPSSPRRRSQEIAHAG